MDPTQQDWDNIVKSISEQTELFESKRKERNVMPRQIPSYEAFLESSGHAIDTVLAEFNETIEPWLSSSNGPRYLGFVTGGAHPSAILGDWIASLYDQNVVTKMDSIASQVETTTANMLLDLFDLPRAYTGTFVTGATMANFVGLACARQWIGEFYNKDISADGVGNLAFKILAGAPHSSIYKVLSMLGIGRNRLKTLSLIAATEKCDMEELEHELKEDSNIPIIFCASAGTVNLVCFDDMKRLAELRVKYSNLWIHTDAAFGMFASLLPEHREKFEGIACSDSITIDCHKWLNTPYDGAVAYVKNKAHQVSTFKNIAPYLNDPDVETADYLHMAPENSRRFRALPVWFLLRYLGENGVEEIVKNCCDRAAELYHKIAEIHQIRVVNQSPINVVCFYVDSGRSENDTKSLLMSLNQSGRVFVTPTVLQGKFGIRAAFSNYSINKVDVENIISAIKEALAEINASNS